MGQRVSGFVRDHELFQHFGEGYSLLSGAGDSELELFDVVRAFFDARIFGLL